ncbi:low affinity immunoglobulin gamma Fc region receptor III-B-like isoform X2 [Engystomops pustulosus]|uniref:low affinity immunoglobulin gamma Fc region receptor III-B-like isoform X2 n=1 Tax=Engystomops pustulosus TaxID=76066 RepID=UPI003AFA877F
MAGLTSKYHHFLCLLVSVLNIRESGGVRPVVTLTPIWREVIYQDPVTITCDVGSPAQEERKYYWYKDGEPMGRDQQSFRIDHVQEEHVGNYQCGTSTKNLSPPVTLTASQEYLILQRPPAIYEGDPLTLRCHSAYGFNGTNTTFYKEDKEIKFSVSDPEFHMDAIDGGASGTYRCTQVLLHHSDLTYHTYSANTSISVQPVSPVVTFTPNSSDILYQDPVTITCDVGSAAPKKQRYYWYKDGKPIDKVKKSFRIDRVRKEHVGDYQCGTSTKNLSPPVTLTAREVSPVVTFTPNSSDILYQDPVTITCDVGSAAPKKQRYYWYKDGKPIDKVKKSFRIDHVREEHVGNYQCGTSTKNLSPPVTLTAREGSSSKTGSDGNIIIGATTGIVVFGLILLLLLFWKCRNTNKPSSLCPNQRVTVTSGAADTHPAQPEEDLCYTYLSMDHLQAASSKSPRRKEDVSVTYAEVKHNHH